MKIRRNLQAPARPRRNPRPERMNLRRPIAMALTLLHQSLTRLRILHVRRDWQLHVVLLLLRS